MLVAEAVGRALAAHGRRHRLRPDGQRQPDRHQRAARRRRALLRRAPRVRRGLHGRRLRRASAGALGRVQRAPGPRADEHDHRPDRGGQEPHAAARARRRHARRGAALELPHRPGRPRRVGRRGRRARARPGDGDGRRRARGAPRARRAPRRRADAAARRAGGSSAPTARAAAATARARAAAPGRGGRRRARPTCCAGARRPAIIAGRGAVLAGAGPRCGRSASSPARCSPPPRSPTACSPATRTPSASPAASPRRWPRGCSARPTSIVAFGAALNQWTTRPRHADRARRDRRPGRPRRGGDRRPPAGRRSAWSATRGDRRGAARRARRPRRRPAPRAARPSWRREIAARRWRDEPYEESRTAGALDPRTLSIALDDLLPDERTVVVDSGALHGLAVDVPARARRGRLRVPAGLPVRRPRPRQRDRRGDRAARPPHGRRARRRRRALSLPELETLGRLGLPLLVVIYDDAAYGAEVHHFGPMGQAVDLAQFPDTDFAALARAAGCHGAHRARSTTSTPCATGSPRATGPLVLDAKVDPDDLRRLARGGLPTLTEEDDPCPCSPTSSTPCASGAVRVVDLTQPLSERTPVLQLPEPFANTPGLSRRELSRYDDRGPGVGVGRAGDRRARRHALRRADPLDHRPRRRGRRQRAARAARRPGGRDRQVRRGRRRTPTTC